MLRNLDVSVLFMRETWVQSCCWEGPLGKVKATHSNILQNPVYSPQVAEPDMTEQISLSHRALFQCPAVTLSHFTTFIQGGKEIWLIQRLYHLLWLVTFIFIWFITLIFWICDKPQSYWDKEKGRGRKKTQLQKHSKKQDISYDLLN